MVENFSIDPLLKTAFNEWSRFRSSYPEKRLTNSELISIRDLYKVDLSPLDISAMLLFDKAYFQDLTK